MTLRNRVIDIGLVIVIIICVILIVRLQKCDEKDVAIAERFENDDGLAKYGITSLDEAKAIVDGTWNETWGLLPKSVVAILYYSVFSAESRGRLLESPYTWTNVSPVFAQKLPENCKVDDSKIVFMSKPFSDSAVLGMYTRGIDLNRGNGPLAMNMGLNVGLREGLSADPQRFSLCFLLRFMSLTGNMIDGSVGDVQLLKMRANNMYNNGVNIALGVSDTQLADTYKVKLRVMFGGDNEVKESDAVFVKAVPNMYYSVMLIRNGGSVTATLYGIDTVGAGGGLLSSVTFAFSDVIDFSNMPIQIGGGQSNLNGLFAMAVYTEALDDKAVADLNTYWRGCLIKTSVIAYAISQQTLTLNACPYGDESLCGACKGVTDWRNVTQLITSGAECRSAYTSYCTANPGVSGCECYSDAAMSSQECTTFKNLMKGTTTCTQAELDAYVRQNALSPENTYNPLGRIRDYIMAEDYETGILPAAGKQVPSFWSWLMGTA